MDGIDAFSFVNIIKYFHKYLSWRFFRQEVTYCIEAIIMIDNYSNGSRTVG